MSKGDSSKSQKPQAHKKKHKFEEHFEELKKFRNEHNHFIVGNVLVLHILLVLSKIVVVLMAIALLLLLGWMKYLVRGLLGFAKKTLTFEPYKKFE